MSAVARVIDEGIGPWTLSADGSALVRGADVAKGAWPRQSGSWSRDERIAVRPGRAHRVTIVGESVARGFMLDPFVTLAGLCRDVVRGAGRGQDVEVVDLAVNNLAPEGALRLCQAAVELGSAAIVLYIGNNLLRSTPWLDEGERDQLSVVLRDEGYLAYLAARRRAIAEAAGRLCTDLRRLRVASGVEVIVVVPAVNLLDWRSGWVMPTWLPEARLREWTAVQLRLDEVPPDSPGPEELTLARRLVELDGGVTARPLEIVGRCLVRAGAEEEGLRLLDAAVGIGADPAAYDRRCPPEAAAQLRSLGRELGFRLVDVPAITRAQYGAEAFGKSSFLDYCHHTPAALRLVAEQVGAEVLAGAGMNVRPAEGAPADVPASDLAVGYLLAALHNQHWGQPTGTVEHWVREALATDPDSVESLAQYFSQSTPAAQFWVRGDQLAGKSDRMYWFLKNFSHQAVLDGEFARRCLRALAADGEALLRELEAAWSRVTVERLGTVNLLEAYWRERNGQPQDPTVFTGDRLPAARYGFIAAEQHALLLDLVLALGPGLLAGRFEVLLNDVVCYTGTVRPDWSAHEIALPASAVRAGLNDLHYRWPVSPRDPKTIESSMSRLGVGPENLHLVRIAQMRLRPAVSPAPPSREGTPDDSVAIHHGL